MDKKLISKIFAEIKKTPTSVTAYEDMFALCRNIEPEDFTLAHKCVDLINVLNQVFAKLSGASTWTKAVKYPTEYAEAADSATAANKELKKTILGIDEINPMQDNSNSNGSGNSNGMDYSKMFEEAEVGDINNPFADFFKPFTEAWANEGQNTINSIKNAFSGIKGFCIAIGESFREVCKFTFVQYKLDCV